MTTCKSTQVLICQPTQLMLRRASCRQGAASDFSGKIAPTSPLTDASSTNLKAQTKFLIDIMPKRPRKAEMKAFFSLYIDLPECESLALSTTSWSTAAPASLQSIAFVALRP